MSATTALRATTELGKKETEEMTSMKAAVYPNLSPAAREWGPTGVGVFVRIEGLLVSHTGIVIRDRSVNGTSATIGGISGVATPPGPSRQGIRPAGDGAGARFHAGAQRRLRPFWSAGMSSSITTPSWAGIVSPGNSSRPNTSDRGLHLQRGDGRRPQLAGADQGGDRPERTRLVDGYL
ncbi:MAG TPA: hypothetical protein VF148_12595 [Acidimicrobiia bacterium]